MPTYQGRALETRPRRAPGGKIKRILRVLGALAVVTGLAHLPWEGLRRRFAVITDVQIEGLHYLDAARVCRAAGVERGGDLLGFDCARARQALLLHPRIERAEVDRVLPRTVRIRIVERIPVLLVRHDVAWEIDSAGVLLAPLAAGAVADVPMLAGPTFDDVPVGARVSSPEVARGLAWVHALSDRELELAGQVSEIDVMDPRRTGLTLMDGTRVLSSAWPPGVRTLSALRVVLADLKARGTAAREVDLRFDNQVIVRPVEATGDTVPGVASPIAYGKPLTQGGD